MSPFRALTCLLLANLLFGMLSPVSKLAMGDGCMDGITLASLRLCGAALLFWVLNLFTPKQSIAREDYIPLFLMSLCGMALNQYLFIMGVSYTAPTNAALATVTTPVVTVVLARLIFKQKVTAGRALGIALAASGVLMLVLGSTAAGGRSGNPVGDMMCMCSQLLSSCYFLFFMKLVKRYNPIVLMKWLFTVSAVVSLPFVMPHLLHFPWADMSPVSIGGSVYVVAGSTFLSYLMLLPAQKHLPTPIVVSCIYIQPVIAATASVAWGLESFTWNKAFAAVMIALGVWLVQHFSRRKEEALAS